VGRDNSSLLVVPAFNILSEYIKPPVGVETALVRTRVLDPLEYVLVRVPERTTARPSRRFRPLLLTSSSATPKRNASKITDRGKGKPLHGEGRAFKGLLEVALF
jgi:hypothetical protein